MTQSFDSYLRDLLGIKDLQASLAAVGRDVQMTRNIVTQILQKEGQIMANLDDILAAVQQEQSDISDAAGRIATMEAQLAAALSANDPVKAQAILDQISAERTAIQALAAPTPAPAP